MLALVADSRVTVADVKVKLSIVALVALRLVTVALVAVRFVIELLVATSVLTVTLPPEIMTSLAS
jgi:hypothetical protein